MNLTIAISKDPEDMKNFPIEKEEKEEGNSILSNDWKIDCIKTLEEVMSKLEDGDGKEAMQAAEHIQMAIEILDPQSDKADKEIDTKEEEENIEGMQQKKDEDYVEKMNKEK